MARRRRSETVDDCVRDEFRRCRSLRRPCLEQGSMDDIAGRARRHYRLHEF